MEALYQDGGSEATAALSRAGPYVTLLDNGVLKRREAAPMGKVRQIVSWTIGILGGLVMAASPLGAEQATEQGLVIAKERGGKEHGGREHAGTTVTGKANKPDREAEWRARKAAQEAKKAAKKKVKKEKRSNRGVRDRGRGEGREGVGQGGEHRRWGEGEQGGTKPAPKERRR